MSEKCEFLEQCGFFQNFKGHTEVIKNSWITMYCDDQERSERCERKRIRRETGKPPADNMSPSGKML